MSNPTTMKELCDYAIHKRKLAAAGHRRKHASDGECSGLTTAEYNKVRYLQKKSNSSKARKFTHNRMWKTHSEKYDLKTLKLSTL